MRGTSVLYWQQRLDHDACLRGVIVKSLLDLYRGLGATPLTARSPRIDLRSSISNARKCCLWTSGGHTLDSLQCRDVPSKPRLSKSVALSLNLATLEFGHLAHGLRLLLAAASLSCSGTIAHLNPIQYLKHSHCIVVVSFRVVPGCAPFRLFINLVILPPSSLLGANR